MSWNLFGQAELSGLPHGPPGPGASPRGSHDNQPHALYLIIGALVVVTAVVGYQLYQERQKKAGIEISVGDRGISIEKK